MRDLRGPDGAGLCRAMRAALLRCAADVYGVSATKLRVFFHYQPQFYHFHVHFTRLHSDIGCQVERAHLLADIIANLRAEFVGEEVLDDRTDGVNVMHLGRG